MTTVRRVMIAAVLLVGGAQMALAADNAERRTLRVGVFPMVIAARFEGDEPVGMAIDLWEKVADDLGAATEYVRLASVAESLSAVHDGKIDVLAGPFAITSEREKLVDFTHAIFHSGMRIAVRQRDETGYLSALKSLVSRELLGLVALLVTLAIVTGHLLWFFERRDNPDPFPTSYFRGVWEAIWWSVSTMITGGCENKPVSTTVGRAIAIAWMLGGIVLVASFTSALTATMTVERVASSIHGPRDLQGRDVACLRGGVQVPAVRQRGGVVEEYDTIEECLDAVALGMADAVVGENQTLMYAISQPGRGGFRLIGTVFDAFDYGMAVATGSPLREQINAALLRIREDGSIDRIREQWLGRHE